MGTSPSMKRRYSLKAMRSAGMMLLAGALAGCADVTAPDREIVEQVNVSGSNQYATCEADEQLCQEPIYAEGYCEPGYHRDAYWHCVEWNYDIDEGGGSDDDGTGSTGTGGSGSGTCMYCDDQVDISQAPDGIDPEWYDQLNDKEKRLCVATFAADLAAGITNPGATKCGQYALSSTTALNWAFAQTDELGQPIPGCTDGPCDAIRHAYWSGLLTRLWGADWATVWTDAHETGVGYDPRTTPMDLHNNRIGRMLATQYTGALGRVIMRQYFENGERSEQLIWLEENE